MDPARIFAIGDCLLEAAQAAITEAGLTIPSRSYVHLGNIAVDCEQLVVTIDGLTFGLTDGPENPAVKCMPPGYSTYTVLLALCVPVPDDSGTPPSTADLEASAVNLSPYGLALTSGIAELIHAGDADCIGLCDNPAMTSALPLGPEGGYGGWTVGWAIHL